MNLIVAAGGDPRDIDTNMREIYDWRHARGLTVVQLGFAPAVVAALAIAAKGASSEDRQRRSGLPLTGLRGVRSTLLQEGVARRFPVWTATKALVRAVCQVGG